MRSLKLGDHDGTRMIGESLGPYEIIELLGVGGMGEVYRARDPKLSRDVAIKVLPAEWAHDAERLARLQREAQLLAQLDHPCVAAIYGLEEDQPGEPEPGRGEATDSSPIHFLVMQVAEGQDLSELIQGAADGLPLEEATAIALQIAEALEAAHEKGIVHRDLKPANIKVLEDSAGEPQVKVLDFGLAKVFDAAGDDASGSLDLSMSPTVAMATRTGIILGTAAYMSPEQARGKWVDKRADIWAFGCVLYEMLTGRKAFQGETVSDTMASILKDEPDWSNLPADLPGSVMRVLRRCLTKAPRDRLRDIGDAHWDLSHAGGPLEAGGGAGEGVSPQGQASARFRRRTIAAAAVTAVLALVVGLFIGGGVAERRVSAERARDITKFTILLPAESRLYADTWPAQNLAISPDGTHIVYKGRDMRRFSRHSLFIRNMDSHELREIPGTERGGQPFFSPDGEWVGYFDDLGNLKKVSLAGGDPITVARDVQGSMWGFGSWGDDGTIVFSLWDSGLFSVSAEGGAVTALTTPAGGETHGEPDLLPGNGALLFTAYLGSGTEIRSLDMAAGTHTTLLENAAHPISVESGHLLFTRDEVLMAVPFDPDRLELLGTPVSIPLDVRPDRANWGVPVPQLAVSRAGTLVYAPADTEFMRSVTFVRVNHAGNEEEIATVALRHPAISLSPDGSRVIAADMQGGETSLQVFDLDRATPETLSRDRQYYALAPLWTSDGSVVYGRTEDESVKIYRGDPDGTTSEEIGVFRGVRYAAPSDEAPDGSIALIVYSPETGGDIWILRPNGEIETIQQGPNHEYAPSFSPDGQWLAYSVNEEEANVVYIQKFPEGRPRRVVATGGVSPRWSPDGKEIYFLQEFMRVESGEWIDGARMTAVDVETEPELRFGEPRVLFQGRYQMSYDTGWDYEVNPDGSGFFMVRQDDGHALVPELHVVLNWLVDLREMVPAGR